MGNKDEKNSLREYSDYIGLGIQLAIAVVFFYFVGKWADDRWNTKPWLSLTGIMLGSAGGFIAFFKKVNELTRKEKK